MRYLEFKVIYVKKYVEHPRTKVEDIYYKGG